MTWGLKTSILGPVQEWKLSFLSDLECSPFLTLISLVDPLSHKTCTVAGVADNYMKGPISYSATIISISSVNRYNGNSWEFFKCSPASLAEHENVPVWNGWCRVTQAVLCPHILTSQIAEHSWDRLEPESAFSRGWGLRLQTKDGFLNPAPCDTELHSQSCRRSHEPSCPFSERANIFALSSPQLRFFFLRRQKCSNYHSDIFGFLLHYKDKHVLHLAQTVFINEKEKKHLQSAAPGWSAGSCVYSEACGKYLRRLKDYRRSCLIS